jgi:ankyrin repeat protein
MKKNLYSKSLKLVLLSILTLTLQIPVVKTMERRVEASGELQMEADEAKKIAVNVIRTKMPWPSDFVRKTANIIVRQERIDASRVLGLSKLSDDEMKEECEREAVWLSKILRKEIDFSRTETDCDKVLDAIEVLVELFNNRTDLFFNTLTPEFIGRILHDSGIALNGFDTLGRTPLFWSITNNCPLFVKILLIAGLNVNNEKYDGRTPLQTAAEQLDATSGMFIKGFVPMDRKVHNRALECAQILRDYYTEKRIDISNGLKTQLDAYAVRVSKKEIAAQLANLIIYDKSLQAIEMLQYLFINDTAENVVVKVLNIAEILATLNAINENVYTLELMGDILSGVLNNVSVSVDVTDESGLTPLTIAAFRGKSALIIGKILLLAGAVIPEAFRVLLASSGFIERPGKIKKMNFKKIL